MAENEAGVPSWADLATPDLDASISYYGSLFGWDARRTDDAAAGTYCMFSIGGRAVAGAGPLTMGGQPPAWTTYVRVDDADGSTAAFREAGGRALVPPMEVMDQGRFAIVADPGGAVLGLWQPRAFAGAAVFNEPGALCWNELATRDLDAAATFYGRTLGWRGETDDAGYTQWMLNGHAVGGMVRMNEEWPAEMPAHWMVYFAVEDVEDAASRASELGGTVMVPPTDTPVGPFSVIRDPHGAGFSITRLAPPPPG
jgi:predicted enzyme related to lactoylglutathione lyase